jgi:hypothetical protein
MPRGRRSGRSLRGNRNRDSLALRERGAPGRSSGGRGRRSPAPLAYGTGRSGSRGRRSKRAGGFDGGAQGKGSAWRSGSRGTGEPCPSWCMAGLWPGDPVALVQLRRTWGRPGALFLSAVQQWMAVHVQRDLCRGAARPHDGWPGCCGAAWVLLRCGGLPRGAQSALFDSFAQNPGAYAPFPCSQQVHPSQRTPSRSTSGRVAADRLLPRAQPSDGAARGNN